MEGLAYDWIPKEQAKISSPALNDVIRFMNSTFEILSATPVRNIYYITLYYYLTFDRQQLLTMSVFIVLSI